MDKALAQMSGSPAQPAGHRMALSTMLQAETRLRGVSGTPPAWLFPACIASERKRGSKVGGHALRAL
jgi:hypothetical protein